MSADVKNRAMIRRAVRTSLAAGALVALLSGCYSYRVDQVDNPVAMPAEWDFQETDATATVVQRDWWTSFGSPVLNELIAQAMQDNPSIIATEERLKQAERAFGQQRDTLFPELSVSASTSRTLSGGNQAPETTRDSTSLGLSTSYTVDLWGSTAANYRINLARFIGTKYDTELARIQLSAQVARAYFNLLASRSRVNVIRENLAVAERLLGITRVRYDNGVTRLFDLTQQDTQVLSLRTQLIQQENTVRQTETALGLLLGRTPQEFRIEGEPIENLNVPEIAPWAPGEMLQRRPDIAGAELDMATAKANVAVARAALIPVTLRLNGSGNSGSQDLISLTDSRTWSLSGALSIATGIFDYKNRRNRVLDQKSNEFIALTNYANTIRTALKEVDDLLATANANRRSEEVQQQSLVNARRSLELIEAERREGSATEQEVREAQRSLFSAQDSLASARISRLTNAIALYQALGGGWVPPAESR